MRLAEKVNDDPARWLEQYGEYLYGFALSRLHNAATAEDLVQETLLSAWRSRQTFLRDSSDKTWLTAILKHKIIDHYRRFGRQPTVTAGLVENELFDEAGGWRVEPGEWRATPEGLLEQREFQEVLRTGLAGLPKNLAAVFTLREIEGLETGEICEILDLTPNNFRVLLYRARLELRRALDDHWFRTKRSRMTADCPDGLAYAN